MPKTDEESKRKELPRREKILDDLEMEGIYEIEMPYCHAEHLISYLFEIGPTISTGNGFIPLSHEEIKAWQFNTGIELQSWESRVLKQLSNDYLYESFTATEPDSIAPWIDAPYFKKQNYSLEAMKLRRSLLKLVSL